MTSTQLGRQVVYLRLRDVGRRFAFRHSSELVGPLRSGVGRWILLALGGLVLIVVLWQLAGGERAPTVGDCVATGGGGVRIVGCESEEADFRLIRGDAIGPLGSSCDEPQVSLAIERQGDRRRFCAERLSATRGPSP